MSAIGKPITIHEVALTSLCIWLQMFNVGTFPTIVVVCNGDIDRYIKYDGDPKAEPLQKWFNTFKDPAVCAGVKKQKKFEPKPLDKNIDYSKLRVKELRAILEERDIDCSAYVEKSDFVKQIQSLL